MEINKSKRLLMGFIILIVICLNLFLLNEVIQDSKTQKTFEKNILLEHK